MNRARRKGPVPAVTGERGGRRTARGRDHRFTWRSALWLLIPLALLTAGSALPVVLALLTPCRDCGRIHVPAMALTFSVGFTAALVYAVVSIARHIKAQRPARAASGGRGKGAEDQGRSMQR